MALGEQAAGRVDHPFATVGVVAIHDQALGLAFRAQAQAFVGQQFVLGKAVVQLDHVDVFGADAGLLVGDVGGQAGHVEADHADHVAGVVGAWQVCGQGLAGDQHIGAQGMLFGECFRHHQCRCGAAGGRAGHQAGQYAFPEHRRGHDVFGADHIAEYRQRVVRSMAAGLGADHGEGFQFGAVLLHVGVAGTGELADRSRQVGHADQLVGQLQGAFGGRCTIGPGGFQGTGVHLLEAEGQGAVHRAACHGLAGQEQCRGAGGAVVVDVDQRDAGHADPVQGFLPARGVAVDVAGIGLLDVTEVQAGIGQGLANRLFAHDVVGLVGARLLERDHADAGNEYFLAHGSFPCCCRGIRAFARSFRA
ncbi:hypothetical protein D3C84_665600 [compost metagenome]